MKTPRDRKMRSRQRTIIKMKPARRNNAALAIDFRMVGIFTISLVLLILHVQGGLSLAHDHPSRDGAYRQHENRKAQPEDHDHKEGEGKKGVHGNEATGQLAAWLLVSANLTVVFSLLSKGANRFLPLTPQKKTMLKRFNQVQKKYLMRIHYVLNPMALCVGLLHFLLASGRLSPLLVWGLTGVTMLVFSGLVLKFKLVPASMRRFAYRFHTVPTTLSTVILLLLVGHLISD
jgi:hypothetical protein